MLLLNEKDMVLQMLGLARALMAAQCKIRLRVLIPAVENQSLLMRSASDILTARDGQTVEIGYTDAEGRWC